MIFKSLRTWLTKAVLSGLMVLTGSMACASTSFQFTYLGTTYDVSTLTGTGYNGFFANSSYLTATDTGGYFMPWYGSSPAAIAAATAFATAGYNSGLTDFSTSVNGSFGSAAFITGETDMYSFVTWNGSSASFTEYGAIPDIVYAVATVAVPEIDGALMPQALLLLGASAFFVRRRRL